MGQKYLATVLLLVWTLLLLPALLRADDREIIILKEDKEEATTSDSEQPLETIEQQNTNVTSFSIFYERWRAFEIAYAEGNKEKQEKLLHEMMSWRNYHSIPSLPQFAASLLQIGEIELQKKHKEDALRFYQAATEFDPSYSKAYYKQAQLFLGNGIGSLVPAARAALQGIVAPRTTVAGKLQWYSKYLLLCIVTLLICAFLFSFILLIKYFRLLRHDVHEKLSPNHRGWLIDAAVWALLFLPLIFLLGPLWLAPFWMMLFWPYTRVQEKIFSLLFLAAFIAAFPVYERATQFVRAYENPATSAYITAFSDGPSPKSISDFQEYVSRNPHDQDATILLAYLYKSDRQTIAATELLQKQIVSNPSDARAYNNLGNIYYIQGEIDSALRIVERASSLDPANGIYLYNISKLQRAKFNFGEAQRKMEEARKADPILVETQEGLPQEKLVDAVPSYRLLWERIRKENGRTLDLFKNPFSLMGGIFLLLTFVIGLSRGTVAHECSKCGKAFCRKCQSSTRHATYCTQCLHIFVKKDGVSPVSRREKMKQIDKHSRQQTFYMRLSSLLVPGSGSLFENRTTFGVAILLAWFFLLSLLFFQKRLSYLSYFDPPETFSVIAPFCLFLLAVLYLVANISFLKKSRAS